MVRTYGFMSTYPPTQCGLAMFTSALRHHLTAATPGSEGRVVRVLAEAERGPVGGKTWFNGPDLRIKLLQVRTR